jgi:hypothetical protein
MSYSTVTRQKVLHFFSSVKKNKLDSSEKSPVRGDSTFMLWLQKENGHNNVIYQNFDILFFTKSAVENSAKNMAQRHHSVDADKLLIV